MDRTRFCQPPSPSSALRHHHRRFRITTPQANCAGLKYEATFTYEGDAAAMVAQLKNTPFHILGVLIGCESGVECCDEISAAFDGFPTNGIEQSAARRDKYPMGEAVRNAGLRAVKQVEVSSWEEALPFLGELGVATQEEATPESPWCVLKPTKSDGSDGVFVAKDIAEAEMRFGDIFGKANVFGEANQTVLVQVNMI